MGQRALFCRSYGHYPADGRRLAAFPVQVLEQEAVLCGQCLPFGGAVQKSLMPKGVDHLDTDFGIAAAPVRAKIFDAERR